MSPRIGKYYAMHLPLPAAHYFVLRDMCFGVLWWKFTGTTGPLRVGLLAPLTDHWWNSRAAPTTTMSQYPILTYGHVTMVQMGIAPLHRHRLTGERCPP